MIFTDDIRKNQEYFLEHYWQKKPLFISAEDAKLLGIDHFQQLVSPEEICELASREEVESRLVQFDGYDQSGREKHWTLQNGFFSESKLKKIFHPTYKKKWTLLVQGVNLYCPEADQLMRDFKFIGYSRLDDLMISYSCKHGTVGAHFDHYDVFLIQGMGQKRWQITSDFSDELLEHVPLKLLAEFKHQEEFIVNEGDILYLPPHSAHYGVALTEGMTYSVGFRTSTAHEIAEGFLNYLQDHLENLGINGKYADPNLAYQEKPAEISLSMLNKVGIMLKQMRWDDEILMDFLGKFLTEPKHNVFFITNDEDCDDFINYEIFNDQSQSFFIELDLATQMLYFNNKIFINGEAIIYDFKDLIYFQELANNRKLLIDNNFSENFKKIIYNWYEIGYLRLLCNAT